MGGMGRRDDMDIILPPKKNIIMDATLLSSLMGCARFLDLRHNRNFVSTKGKSNSLEIGSLAHKVLEVFYKHLINGFSRTQAIGQAMIAGHLYITGCPHCASGIEESPVCKHEQGEYPGLKNTPEESEKNKVGWKFAMMRMEQYFEYYKNDALIFLAAETVKGDVIYEDDEIRVLWKAKFDLIVDTNQVGIISADHKTFKQRRDKTTLSNQFSGQCVILKARRVLVNKIGWQTSLKIEECLTREMVCYTADRLLEWQSEIVPYYAYKYIQYAEAEHWPPNYTHCDTMYGPCIFKDVCEADRNMRAEVLQNEYMIGPKWDPSNKEEE
jgi:hypothetical protein